MAMTIAQANIKLEHANKLAPIAHRRMIGSEHFVVLYQVAGILVGMTLGAVLAVFVPLAFIWNGWLIPTSPAVQALQIFLAVLGWNVGLALAQRRHREKFFAGLRKRGMPDSVNVAFAVSDLGLQIASPRIQHSVTWDAVLEIVSAPGAWLVQADQLTILVPHGAFASDADQREFIKGMLAHMSPEARDRSVEAMACAIG